MQSSPQLCIEKTAYSLISVQVVQVDNRPVSSVEPVYFFAVGLSFLQPFDQAIQFFVGIKSMQNDPQPLPPTLHRRREDRPDIQSHRLQALRHRLYLRIPGDHHYLDRRFAVQPLQTDLGSAKPVD